MRKFGALLLPILLCATARSSGAVLVTAIDDNFTDGMRAKTGATDANFFVVTSAVSIGDGDPGVATNNAILFGAGNPIVLATYAPITLVQPGHYISAQVDFRYLLDPGANSSASPIFGLYSSNGTTVTGDGAIGVGSNTTNSQNDKGYYGDFRTASTANAGQTNVGVENGDGLPFILGGGLDRVDSTSTSTFFLDRNSTALHQFVLKLTRQIGNQLLVELFADNLVTPTTSATFAVPLTFTFDEFAFRSAGLMNNGSIIDNVIVTAVVPEPTLAGLVGLPALMMLLADRRRRV